mmetsp:Transcript_53934/g.139361  ORF Transcript_53934/g.139361 Transcript_53934/m.139361 type:complete len:223 (+) Transcript_53934:146-814(+)
MPVAPRGRSHARSPTRLLPTKAMDSPASTVSFTRCRRHPSPLPSRPDRELKRHAISGGVSPHRTATGYAPARSIAPKKAAVDPAVIEMTAGTMISAAYTANARTSAFLRASLSTASGCTALHVRPASLANECSARQVPMMVVVTAVDAVMDVNAATDPPLCSSTSTGSVRSPPAAVGGTRAMPRADHESWMRSSAIEPMRMARRTRARSPPRVSHSTGIISE